MLDRADARDPGLGDLAARTGDRGRLGHQPLLPCRGDIGGQAEGANAGVVQLQIAPEQLAQHIGQVRDGGVVAGDQELTQVVDEKVTDGRYSMPYLSISSSTLIWPPTANARVVEGALGGKVPAERSSW